MSGSRRIVSRVCAFGRTFLRAEKGATAVITALFIVGALGLSALVIDVGRAMQVQRALQTSADAAALAGAQDLSCTSADTSTTTAANYSASTGGYNTIPGVSAGSVSFSAVRKSLTSNPSVFGSCPSPGANAIFVTESVAVPTILGSVLGVDSITVAVKSAAAGRGGPSANEDVVLILDSTGSMSQDDPTTSKSSTCYKVSKIACAEQGLQAILLAMGPPTDQVALATFPGLTSASQAQKDSSCTGGSPQVAQYGAASNYYFVAPVNNGSAATSPYFDTTYKSSGTATTLDTSDALPIAIGAGSCAGIHVVGGVGTYFADAVAQATTLLTNDGRTLAKKYIVLISDGGAGSSSGSSPATGLSNSFQECTQAVTNAQTAKNAGITVITVGYGASASALSCYDGGTVSSKGVLTPNTTSYSTGCAVLQAMASTGYFYYDSGSACTGGQTAADVATVLKYVAGQLGSPAMIPISTS